MTEIEQQVIRLVADTQKIDLAEIRPESTFEELKIDSLDGLNLLFAVEGEFDIQVPDDEAKNLRSVQDIINGVNKLLAAKQGAKEG
ncbi:MAG: acyl carrier protein [Bryobacterales bacterium]